MKNENLFMGNVINGRIIGYGEDAQENS